MHKKKERKKEFVDWSRFFFRYLTVIAEIFKGSKQFQSDFF